MSDQPRDDPPARPNGKPRVVQLPLKREVAEEHLAHLRSSGLSDETIELAELYTERQAKAVAELLGRRTFPRLCGWCLVFPFRLPGGDAPIAYRVRPSRPRVDKRSKPVKYEQASGEYGVLVYFPPRSRTQGWYQQSERPLHWTEGEKKALVLDQMQLATIGLTGVNMWHDAKHRDATGEWRLHPTILEHVAIAGRKHVIVFDADAVTNDNVMSAAQRLCGTLLAAGATEVRFVCSPSADHKGIDDYFAAFGELVTQQLLATAQPLEPLDPRSPLVPIKRIRALREAPVANDMRMPEGYEVRRDGSLWVMGDAKHGAKLLAPSAVLIMRHLDDYYVENERRVEVCFRLQDQWVRRTVNRLAIFESRSMVNELVRADAPITGNTASRMVDWFAAFDHANAGIVPRIHCLPHVGWHTIEGQQVFALDEVIGADGEATTTVVLDKRGDRRRLFEALAPRGDFQLHLDALKWAWAAEPACAAMICGALAATLLKPLGAANFAIHLFGDSSRGKTSMLKVAASVFGDPSSAKWVASWNASAAALELRAAALTDLPQCYDEVGAGDTMQLERAMYMLINGDGRGRGQKDMSLRETASWRTVVLSTGEAEVVGSDVATGAQVRVVQLPVAGFGNLGAAQVDQVREQCTANAGSFGRAWVENLLRIEDWAAYREGYRAALEDLRRLRGGALQGRIAAYYALLMLAEDMASQLGLGCAGGQTMRELFLRDDSRQEVLPAADRALALVTEWVLSEPDAFPELSPNSAGEDEPRGGSNRPRHGFRKDGLLMFLPKQLEKFLHTHRLSMAEVVREWHRYGWLQVNEGSGRLTRLVRADGQVSRLYVLRQPEGADS